MLDLLKLFSREADTTVVMPGPFDNNLYQAVFFKDGADKPFGTVSLAVSDCYEFIQDKELDNTIISILDRIVLIDALRRHLSAMKTTKSDIIDVFANGRATSVKLLLTTKGVEETLTAIFDRDNEELILHPDNIEVARQSFYQPQIKGDYVHLDKDTISKLQVNLKLNHLERTDPECLIAAFCDFYDYIQETK